MNMRQRIPRLGGKENLWARLADDLPNPQPFDAQAGLWGHIVMSPGGLWSDVRDETLILEQRIFSVWDDVDDETLIIRPRFNVWERAATPRLDRPETQPQPPSLWDEVEDETLSLGRVDLTMWVMPTVRSMATYRPQRATGWALKKLETAAGDDYYVLKNMQNGTYLRLNEHQEYLWHLLDGSYTLQDLAVASFMRFGAFNVEWLSNYLAQLKFKGFLVDTDQDVYAAAQAEAERRTLRYWLKRAVSFVFQSEFNLPVEHFYTSMYRAGGWVLFTRVAQVLILLVTLAGIPAYYLATQGAGVSLLGGQGSAAVGIGVIGLIAAQTIIFFIHESMHALTTKHYKRQVRRGGVGLYFGMIAFFIDTTDIWMEPRGPRLRVTWAGPYSGFFLGSAASLLLLIAPQAIWAGFAYQLATLAYWISLINLNPLLKLDGYYILMDWLEMPMLRERSIEFVRHKLIPKLGKRERFTRDEKIYAVFGTLSLLCSAAMIVLLIRLYGERILNFVLSLI